MPAKQFLPTEEIQAVLPPPEKREAGSTGRETAEAGPSLRQKHAVLRIRPQAGLLPDQAYDLLVQVSDRLWDALPFSGESRRRNGLLVLEPEEPVSIAAIERCLGPLARQVTIEVPEGSLPPPSGPEEKSEPGSPDPE